MSKLLAQFQADCDAAGVSPTKVLETAGLHRSLWYRWRDGKSLTVKSLEMAMDALANLKPVKRPVIHSPTLTDLTQSDNVTQARHELNRACSSRVLSVWAEKWGGAALRAIEAHSDEVDADISELKDDLDSAESHLSASEDEKFALEQNYEHLSKTAEGVVEELRKLTPFHERLGPLADELEAAIS